MKNLTQFITIFFLGAFLLIGTALSPGAFCDGQILKHEIIKMLKPDFKYDSSEITRVALKGESQKKKIKVPLFMGEEYRFLFNTKGMPDNVKIKITNRRDKVIYDNSEELEEGKDVYVFEPRKGRNLTIHYEIPAVEEDNIRGCIVFLLGYKL